MTDDLDFNLFEQVHSKLADIDNSLAQRLAEAVEEAYQASGKRGVEKLFIEIRERYVGKIE